MQHRNLTLAFVIFTFGALAGCDDSSSKHDAGYVALDGGDHGVIDGGVVPADSGMADAGQVVDPVVHDVVDSGVPDAGHLLPKKKK